MRISRRTILKNSTSALVASAIPFAFENPPACAEAHQASGTQLVPAETDRLHRIANDFMQQFELPGLSVAIARRGEFVYQSGFGYADKSTGEPVTTTSRFRIASVSKPITSVAIFTLIEQGKLRLETTVFGPGGVLGDDFGADHPENVNTIRLHHLLTHTGGGWHNDGNDPMFLNQSMNHHDLIAWTIRNQPLKTTPGSAYAYSNFGFCVLGRVIEKVTGKLYRDFVNETVLSKCGVTKMQIGTNMPAADEVRYYPLDGPTYHMNVERMDSHGGWIAAPADLVRFAMHVDGFDTTRNILRPDTLSTMTQGTSANAHYACGWAVNSVPNWWHNGSLPGTSSIMVRTAHGLVWAAITNKRAEGIDLALDQFMWKMATAIPAWKA